MEFIIIVYRKQKKHEKSGDEREYPGGIVSVSKPHIRLIVGGKEIKSVEFGAKCNNILNYGISFIDKLSFTEETKLKHCVSLAPKLIGVDVKKYTYAIAILVMIIGVSVRKMELKLPLFRRDVLARMK